MAAFLAHLPHRKSLVYRLYIRCRWKNPIAPADGLCIGEKVIELSCNNIYSKIWKKILKVSVILTSWSLQYPTCLLQYLFITENTCFIAVPVYYRTYLLPYLFITVPTYYRAPVYCKVCLLPYLFSAVPVYHRTCLLPYLFIRVALSNMGFFFLTNFIDGTH